jgi:hypothetical protein
VVLNFAKVLTYSRVLLYTLEREEKEGEKKDRTGDWEGQVVMKRHVSTKSWMAMHDWGWRGKVIGE